MKDFKWFLHEWELCLPYFERKKERNKVIRNRTQTHTHASKRERNITFQAFSGLFVDVDAPIPRFNITENANVMNDDYDNGRWWNDGDGGAAGGGVTTTHLHATHHGNCVLFNIKWRWIQISLHTPNLRFAKTLVLCTTRSSNQHQPSHFAPPPTHAYTQNEQINPGYEYYTYLHGGLHLVWCLICKCL